MTTAARPPTARDAPGAGGLLTAANTPCAAVGVEIGALVGALLPLLLAAFFVGFPAGVALVANCFRQL
jgi:hypothetical protein